MTDNHTELCERLREGSSPRYIRCKAANLIESQAARIAKLEKERDALKADAERYDFLRCRAELREYSMGFYWYIKTIDAPIGMPVMAATLANVVDAALQAEKETRS